MLPPSPGGPDGPELEWGGALAGRMEGEPSSKNSREPGELSAGVATSSSSPRWALIPSDPAWRHLVEWVGGGTLRIPLTPTSVVMGAMHPQDKWGNRGSRHLMAYLSLLVPEAATRRFVWAPPQGSPFPPGRSCVQITARSTGLSWGGGTEPVSANRLAV